MALPVSEGGREISRSKQLPLILVALVLAGIFLLLSGIVHQNLDDVAAARAEERMLKRRKERLEEHISRMQTMLSALESHPDAVGSLARTELGWIGPGERVVYLQTPTPIPAPEVLTGDQSPPILTLPE